MADKQQLLDELFPYPKYEPRAVDTPITIRDAFARVQTDIEKALPSYAYNFADATAPYSYNTGPEIALKDSTGAFKYYPIKRMYINGYWCDQRADFVLADRQHWSRQKFNTTKLGIYDANTSDHNPVILGIQAYGDITNMNGTPTLENLLVPKFRWVAGEIVVPEPTPPPDYTVIGCDWYDPYGAVVIDYDQTSDCLFWACGSDDVNQLHPSIFNPDDTNLHMSNYFFNNLVIILEYA